MQFHLSLFYLYSASFTTTIRLKALYILRLTPYGVGKKTPDNQCIPYHNSGKKKFILTGKTPAQTMGDRR